MFNQRNPQAAFTLAARIPNDVTIFPSDATPLAAATRQAIATASIGFENDAAVGPALVAAAENSPNQERAINDLVTLGSRAIEAQLRFIRNDVVSDVEEVFTKVQTELGHKLEPMPYSTIVTMTYPDVLDTDYMVELSSRYQRGGFVNPQLMPDMFPEFTGADLLTIIQPAGRLVAEEMTKLGELYPVPFTDIYNKVFRGVVAPNYPKPSDRLAPFYQEHQFIEAILTSVLCEQMYISVPPSIQGNLAQVNSTLTALAVFAAGTLNAGMQYRNILDRNQKLYITKFYKNGSGVIVLYRANYDIWLEMDAHSPEAILGLDVQGKLGSGISDLSDNDFIAAAAVYKQDQATKRMLLNEKRSDVITSLTEKYVEQCINESDSFEQFHITIDQAISRLRQTITNTPYYNNEDIYNYVRIIVTESMYWPLRARRILEAMDNYGKENPELDARACGLLVTRDVLCSWLSSMLVIKDC